MQRLTTTGALAAALVVPAAVSAQDSSADLAAMRAELAQMRAELAQLRGDTASSQATADLHAATNAALEDARTRINYETEELYAGHDGKKFVLSDPEGNFLLNIGGQIQGRYVYNNRSGQTGGAITAANDLAGFQLRRMKLKFSGHLGDPKIGYAATIVSNRDSLDTALELATISYKFDNGIKVTGGRFKGPFSFDELTSSTRQQAAERSAVNDVFTIGHTEGIQLESKPADGLKLRVMLNDGAGAGEITSAAGGFADFNENRVDFAVTGRADYVVVGDKSMKFAKDYTSWSDDEASLLVGGGFHHEQVKSGVLGGVIAGPGAGLDSFQRFTVDALYNNSGMSFAAAAFFETQQAVAGGTEADPFGFLVQGGYTIDDTWEPFVRYEYNDFDTATGDWSIITAGVNWYQKKHAAKATLDVSFGLDPLSGVSDGAGLAGDAAGEDGQIAVRAQYQLLF